MSDSNGASSSKALSLSQSPIPKHVAIIMDGNGRWAKTRGFPRVEGHRAGVKSVRMVVEESRRLGVRYLTLYAFSSENWARPKDEVHSLMGLFRRYLDSELKLLLENDIRLRAIGDRELLPGFVRESLERNEERTKDLDGMDLVLAVSYGGRGEIVRAVTKLAQKVETGEISAAAIDEKMLGQHLDAPDVPDPDLLIRTSDENRISNFLLWQLAYSEIVVTPVLWPDFTKEEYHRCLKEFAERDRRFGLTQEQIERDAPLEALNS